LKVLKEYALTNGFAVAQEYVDVETARQAGRAAFGEMVAYLKAHPSVRVMLVEKTDRLYRNLKDWVTIDELDVELHFPKEGVVLSRDSRSSEKFMHGIKVLMAKNYIDNLSEEARKGMQEKAEQGIWPTKTPLGYRNVTGPDGKKIIATDPAIAPLIAKLFEWYSRGDISLREAARKVHAAGLAYPKSGAKVPVSTIHTILRNRLYTGWLEWNGKLIQGRHEPLVSVELWERVQDVIDGRFSNNAKRGRRDFAFSGLISCKRCGCAVVGEIKKQRYVYYHCTGYADKCQGNPASCRRLAAVVRFLALGEPRLLVGDFVDQPVLPFPGITFLPDRSIERHIAAETAVHVDHVLFGHAEPPGNDLDLVGPQIALLQRRDLALCLAQIEEQFLLVGGRTHLHQRP
jgi:site-specific DNA recombinase